jgi:hypothetical protein
MAVMKHDEHEEAIRREAVHWNVVVFKPRSFDDRRTPLDTRREIPSLEEAQSHADRASLQAGVRSASVYAVNAQGRFGLVGVWSSQGYLPDGYRGRPIRREDM